MKLEKNTIDSVDSQNTLNNYSKLYITTKDYSFVNENEIQIKLSSIDSEAPYLESKLLSNSNICSTVNYLKNDYKNLEGEIELLNRRSGDYTLTLINKVEDNFWF